MSSLYDKIYEAIDNGIQKALIVKNDQSDDISIGWHEKKLTGKVNIKKLQRDKLKKDIEQFEYLISRYLYKDAYSFAINTPDFKYTVTSKKQLRSLIEKIIEIDVNCDLNWIDVHKIKTMDRLFTDLTYTRQFNGKINEWDVSNVTNMGMMFDGCKLFNCPIDSWDVSNVTNMFAMFRFCDSFNQPLNAWNTEKVLDMRETFAGCKSFNQDLNNWKTRHVKDFTEMFYECKKFDGNLDGWIINNDAYESTKTMFEYCNSMSKKPEFEYVYK